MKKNHIAIEYKKKIILQFVTPSVVFISLYLLSKFEVFPFNQIGYALGYYGAKLIEFLF